MSVVFLERLLKCLVFVIGGTRILMKMMAPASSEASTVLTVVIVFFCSLVEEVIVLVIFGVLMSVWGIVIKLERSLQLNLFVGTIIIHSCALLFSP